MTASVGSMIFGSGTFSMRTSPALYMTVARIMIYLVDSLRPTAAVSISSFGLVLCMILQLGCVASLGSRTGYLYRPAHVECYGPGIAFRYRYNSWRRYRLIIVAVVNS